MVFKTVYGLAVRPSLASPNLLWGREFKVHLHRVLLRQNSGGRAIYSICQIAFSAAQRFHLRQIRSRCVSGKVYRLCAVELRFKRGNGGNRFIFCCALRQAQRGAQFFIHSCLLCRIFRLHGLGGLHKRYLRPYTSLAVRPALPLANRLRCFACLDISVVWKILSHKFTPVNLKRA